MSSLSSLAKRRWSGLSPLSPASSSAALANVSGVALLPRNRLRHSFKTSRSSTIYLFEGYHLLKVLIPKFQTSALNTVPQTERNSLAKLRYSGKANWQCQDHRQKLLMRSISAWPGNSYQFDDLRITELKDKADRYRNSD